MFFLFEDTHKNIEKRVLVNLLFLELLFLENQ